MKRNQEPTECCRSYNGAWASWNDAFLHDVSGRNVTPLSRLRLKGIPKHLNTFAHDRAGRSPH